MAEKLDLAHKFYLIKSFLPPDLLQSLCIKKQKSDKTWLRYGLGLQLNRHESAYMYNATKSFSAALLPRMGFEKRNPLAKSWSLLYGGEAFLRLTYIQQQNFNRHFNGDIIYETTHYVQKKTYGGGIRPFLGIAFNITPRLYVATEASAVLELSRGNQSTEEFRTGAAPNSVHTDIWNYGFNLRPASAIFVYYRF